MKLVVTINVERISFLFVYILNKLEKILFNMIEENHLMV